jgi:hypothetical protein
MRGRGDVWMKRSRRKGHARVLVGFGVAAALVAGACTSQGTPAPFDGTPATASAGGSPSTIPQPVVPGDLPLAPESERVDITMPTFSDPLNVTNPHFPVSLQESVLLLGQVEGQPFRTEVTLLPETRILEWEGQRVEVLVSQYCAFLGGEITEVAYDLYAQADDGSVWYLGEDVFDFRDGAIVVTEGSWLAGRDGPAAMIMPADPQVGDVYRPENAPGFVFEEVTVKSVTETLDGPLGPVEGGMISSELHRDGSREGKIFAPGYGEFFTSGGGDVEALALAVPTDAASGPVPAELTTLSEGGLFILDSAEAGSWRAASATASDMAAAWKTEKAAGVPRLIEPVMDEALATLAAAVDARGVARARNAAIEVARLSFDLQLRYRPVTEIDLARMDLWAAQLVVDEAASDTDAIGADAFALDYVRDRILDALDGSTLVRVNTELGAIQIAVVDEEPAAAAKAAGRLRAILAEVAPTS